MADFAQLMYGTAQNAAQNVGNGLPENVAKGAELALKKEQLMQQKQQNEAQQQAVLNTRIEKFHEDLMKVSNYKDPSAQKNYMKMMAKRRDVWGLQDLYSDDAMSALLIPEDFGKQVTLAREVQDPKSPYYGRPDLAAKTFNDPVKRAEIMSTPPEGWGDKPPESADLNRAFEQYRNRQVEIAKHGQKEAQDQKREDRINEQKFREYGASLNDDVSARFKPVVEQKKSLDLVDINIREIEADYAKNKKLNPNMISATARSVVKAFNSGAMTDNDVADLAIRPGAEGWSERQWNKYLAGGGDIKLVRNLHAIAKNNRKALVIQGKTVADGLRGRLSAYPDRKKELDEQSGFSAYERSLIGTGGAKTVDFMGKTFTADGLRGLAAKVKNPKLKQQALDAAAALEKGK